MPAPAHNAPLPPPASWAGRLLAWPVTLTGDEPPEIARRRRTACAIACWEVLAFQSALILTTGDIITALALHLAFTPLGLGILAVLPSSSTILHPIGAWAVEKLGRKKPLHLWLAALARLTFFIPVLCYPMWPDEWRRPFVLGGLIVSNALFALATNAWQAWMGDLSDGILRGRFFGIRNMLSAISALIISPLSLWLLGEQPTDWEFRLLFLVGLGAALLSLGLMLLQDEIPPPPRPKEIRTREVLLAPLRDLNFRRLLAWRLTHDLGVFIAAPFWLVYHREIGGLSFATVAGFSIAAQVCAMAGYWVWGHVADRMGHKPVVMLGVLGAGLTPLFWYWYSPLTWPMMIFEAAMSGWFWSGMLAQSYTLVVATAPAQGRSMVLALVAAASGVAALVGGAIGGALAEWTLGWRQPFGDPAWGFALVGYHLNFTLSMLLRIGSLGFLRQFHEPGARATLVVLGWLVDSRGWRKGFFSAAEIEPATASRLEAAAEHRPSDA